MKTSSMTFAGLVAAASLIWAAPAAAQFAKPEDAIKYRQSAFTVMSNQMGRLAAMAQGKVPFDALRAQAAARAVDTLAHLPWDAFPTGSNTGAAKLKGDLWKDAEQFQTLQAALKTQTAKLAGAAGSLETLRAQVGPTAQACRNCHEKFRQVR